jgi:hypothetical protein
MPSIKDQVRVALNKDGVDHVNVSAYSETEIGKIASPDWRKKFYVPHVGDFVSARTFANWIVSGGKEELRHSTAFYKTTVPTGDFRLLLVFAKYYQLCSLRSNLLPEESLVNLPWVMYKKHFSGVREFDRWSDYAEEVKPLVAHVLEHGSKGHYPWEEAAPDHLACLNFYLQRVVGDDFVPFEELNRIAKQRNAERAKADKQRQKDLKLAKDQETQHSEVLSTANLLVVQDTSALREAFEAHAADTEFSAPPENTPA